MTIGIIGTGLIGGSIAIGLRENAFAKTILGMDACEKNLAKAVELGLLDEAVALGEMQERCDVIIVATPVDALVKLLPKILDNTSKNQTVLDVGSTKLPILQAIASHPKRHRFVATHPMAGTEYSGPTAAIPNLFEGKCCVFCEAEKSAPDAVETARQLYQSLGMRITHLNGEEHDLHTAYVSHISHIASFALALTVLEKEQEEKRIFELASGGFSSTVRLAKSSPDTWIPIFRQNRDCTYPNPSDNTTIVLR